jgi:hypothetical protein
LVKIKALERVLTAGTGKFLCRFVQVCPWHRQSATRVHTTRFFIPTTPQQLLRFHSIDSVAPARVHSATPARVRSSQLPRKGTLRNPRKGSLTCALPRHAMRMRSDAMRHRSSSATNCGGEARSATTCDEMRCDMMRHR